MKVYELGEAELAEIELAAFQRGIDDASERWDRDMLRLKIIVTVALGCALISLTIVLLRVMS